MNGGQIGRPVVIQPTLFDGSGMLTPRLTTDDCYTPRWVFDAMGITFTIDVAAPPGGAPLVPADRYFTAADDGLAQLWRGSVWCNPPFSRPGPWAERFAQHDRIAFMGIVGKENRWLSVVFAAAEVVAFISCDFTRPGLPPIRPIQAIFVAFRGLGHDPARRLSDADPYGSMLLGMRP